MRAANISDTCVSCGFVGLNFQEEKDGYELYECQNCNLQFWQPFAAPGHEYYEESWRYAHRNLNPKDKELYDAQKLFLKSGLKPGGKVLDLGMGSGRFILALQEHGYQVTGTDFDNNGVRAAREIFGLTDVYNYDLATYFKHFPDRQFDIITIFSVLEHLDSFDILPLIYRALVPGGLFALEVPNKDGWKEWMRGEGPPLHFTRWSKQSMRTFLERFGFEVVHLKALPLDFKHILSVFPARTAGFLSFSTVSRIESAMSKSTAPGDRAPALPQKSFFMSLLRALSYIKLYVLFGIPALVLYAYLWATGKIFTELYVIAKKPELI